MSPIETLLDGLKTTYTARAQPLATDTFEPFMASLRASGGTQKDSGGGGAAKPQGGGSTDILSALALGAAAPQQQGLQQLLTLLQAFRG